MQAKASQTIHGIESQRGRAMKYINQKPNKAHLKLQSQITHSKCNNLTLIRKSYFDSYPSCVYGKIRAVPSYKEHLYKERLVDSLEYKEQRLVSFQIVKEHVFQVA